MAKFNEINYAIKVLVKNGTKKNIIILHCISDYPTKIENVNLNFINTLKKFQKMLVSDHTLGTQSAILSVALKAKLLKNILL